MKKHEEIEDYYYFPHLFHHEAIEENEEHLLIFSTTYIYRVILLLRGLRVLRGRIVFDASLYIPGWLTARVNLMPCKI